MDYLIKDKTLHYYRFNSTDIIFLNKYIKTNNLNYDDIKNIFREK